MDMDKEKVKEFITEDMKDTCMDRQMSENPSLRKETAKAASDEEDNIDFNISPQDVFDSIDCQKLAEVLNDNKVVDRIIKSLKVSGYQKKEESQMDMPNLEGLF